MATRKKLYNDLGIDDNATQAQIRTAYLNLSKKNHPDKNPGNPQAEQTFKRTVNAYEILSDADKRMQYDQGLIDDSGKPQNTMPGQQNTSKKPAASQPQARRNYSEHQSNTAGHTFNQKSSHHFRPPRPTPRTESPSAASKPILKMAPLLILLVMLELENARNAKSARSNFARHEPQPKPFNVALQRILVECFIDILITASMEHLMKSTQAPSSRFKI